MDSGVQFEEDDPILNPEFVNIQRARRARKSGSITSLIISWKLAKNEQQANVVLIIIAILILAIAGFLVYATIPHQAPAPPPVVEADLGTS